ncbi:c-type cytochrome [Plantactinospora sp. WMMC1484]|uniref:cytochrome bc1 complex diheme cytochrome c subunit n=1 Tax=Plantactinospora sp. WMMC1484 TaxID=3404122 RepID=UPI003BF55A10
MKGRTTTATLTTAGRDGAGGAGRRVPGTSSPVCRPFGRRRLVVAAVLGLAAGPVPLPGYAAPAPTPSVDPAAARGAELYLRSCASCHGPAGQGSQRAPSLVGVGPASVDFQLNTGRMPVQKEVAQVAHREPAFDAEEIRALVAHVASFGGGGPQIPTVGPGDLREGRELYLSTCAACHSATGVGATLSNGFVAPSLDRSSPIQVAEAIRVGPGLMPVFPESVLSQQQVDALAGYVQELRGDRLDRGGASLGRLGPTTEGLVAWGIGLVLLVLVARWLGSRAGE